MNNSHDEMNELIVWIDLQREAHSCIYPGSLERAADNIFNIIKSSLLSC